MLLWNTSPLHFVVILHAVIGTLKNALSVRSVVAKFYLPGKHNGIFPFMVCLVMYERQ